ncbi:MAG: phage integrase SAM-like domain-containing protein [Bacteroidota bacterium]
MAIKVKLRSKSISGNRQSLYLDFYPPIPHPETDIPTRREFLNLFLHNEFEIEEQKHQDEEGKKHNEQTLKLAGQIRLKRDNQLNKPEIYTGYEKEQLKIKERENISFLEYFNHLVKKRKSSNHDNWVSASHYLEKFSGGMLKFADLNEKFCNDFRDYLCKTPSSRSSQQLLTKNLLSIEVCT